MAKIDWKKKYPDWDESAMNCGPNKYIAGNAGDDFDAWNDIQVYYNREAEVYYVDQVEPTKDLKTLYEQLLTLVQKIKEYLDKK